ncbi:MAG: amidophosphoribosyltransferase [Firmicutes bacterium]|nr:amidophosphoribosyltransferase [Bacillota bacterium]
MEYDIYENKLNEECGVFGIYSKDHLDVAKLTYYGLFALQHRGQESTGIAVNDAGTIIYYKDIGLVSEVFNDTILEHLKGEMAIGHVRYTADVKDYRENIQPIVIKYKEGQLALAYNGTLVNANQVRSDMEEKGAIFQTNNDAEIIANLISRYRISSGSIEESLIKTMKDIKGAYAFVVLTPHKLIGIRDSLGIKPLCIGMINNSYVFSSESCALDAVGAEFTRDVNPGEIVVIDENGIRSIQTEVPGESRLCIFEFVYFARHDSYIDGVSVYEARLEAGRRLAIEHPVDADIVIGAPDSGLIAAMGFSRQSGIPYGTGLIKNRYVGRTFIRPGQEQREIAVKIKFNAIRSEIEGKRIVMVDDSIVRGTTTKAIVQMLKSAGAREVHIRVSSPPYRFPCYYGIDTPSREQLMASTYSLEEIRNIIGADSLEYLSLEGLMKTPIGSKCNFCCACFNGEYPIEIPCRGEDSNADI